MNTHQSNFSIFGPVSPEIMRSQARHFWRGHLIRAVLAILCQVLHSFYRVVWVMRQGLALACEQSFAPRPLVIPYQTFYWTQLVQQLRTKRHEFELGVRLYLRGLLPSRL